MGNAHTEYRLVSMTDVKQKLSEEDEEARQERIVKEKRSMSEMFVEMRKGRLI